MDVLNTFRTIVTTHLAHRDRIIGELEDRLEILARNFLIGSEGDTAMERERRRDFA